jgi:hypothetical protein
MMQAEIRRDVAGLVVPVSVPVTGINRMIAVLSAAM